MVRDVEAVSADLSVADAVAVLEAGRHRIYPVVVLEAGRHRIYPVVDAEARPVGLVSRADALRWKTDSGASEEKLEERISDVSVVDLMLRNDLGRIPVTDRQSGRLVGLLTRKDLLQVHARTSRSERERAAYLIGGA
jgi:CBS domain-containing protein